MEFTKEEIEAMVAALEFYADRDNWRSGADHLTLTRLDPEYVSPKLTGKNESGIRHGWEVAEHALKTVIENESLRRELLACAMSLAACGVKTQFGWEKTSPNDNELEMATAIVSRLTKGKGRNERT